MFDEFTEIEKLVVQFVADAEEFADQHRERLRKLGIQA